MTVRLRKDRICINLLGEKWPESWLHCETLTSNILLSHQCNGHENKT